MRLIYFRNLLVFIKQQPHGNSKCTSRFFILKYILYIFSPELTWRDVQHLIVETSKRHDLQDDFYHWQRNGAGFYGKTLLLNDISGVNRSCID